MTPGPQSRPRLPLVLPMALIGPRAQGRSYGVLAASSGFAPSESMTAALTDVALVLSAWAERGAGAFAMLVPLERSGLSLLMRARYVGRAELGQVALGVAVFVDRAAVEALGHRVHRLLERLPDELPREGFGPLVVDPQSLQAPPARLPDIGLGWEDAIVDARGQDPEAVLSALLEAVEPDEQRARITGWASSGGLARKGRLAPSEACNLIVHAPDDKSRLGEAPAGRRRLSLDALPQPQPPPAWEAWRRLKGLQGLPSTAWAQVAALRWSPDNARLKPADVLAVAVVQACVALGVGDRAALLARIAREPFEGFADAFERGLETLARAAASPHQLAGLLAAFLARADQEALKRLSRVLDLFSDWEVVSRLGPAEIATLLQIGLVAILAGRGDAPPQGSPLLEPLLADACRRAGGNAQIHAFAVTLVCAAAQAEGETAAVRAAISTLLALPASAEDRRLATPCDRGGSRIGCAAPGPLGAGGAACAARPAQRARPSRGPRRRAAAGADPGGRCMKICSRCATPYPEEAFAACPTCELIEASLRSAAAAAVPDDQLKAELGVLQAAVYGAPAADTLLAERPAEAAPLSFVPPLAGEPEQPAVEGEITFERLEALRRSGRMVIGLLGFPTAGKTWFLNRLKDNWEQPGNTANPPKAPGGSRVGATQDVAEHVFLKPGGGFYILDLPGERFEAAAKTSFRNDPILLAAINACGALAVILPADEALFSGRAASRYEAQGEVLPAGEVSLDEVVAAAKARLAEAEKELARVRRRVKTDASETNIAALEAALAARDAAKAEHRDLSARLMNDRGSGLAQAHQRLEAFISGLGRVSGLLSLQASGAASGPLGPDEVDRHVMSDAFRPFPKPICIALSKADCLLDDKGLAAELTEDSPVDRVWRDSFDRDPLATIHHFRPTLARQFDRWFRWVKFDFLTAFGGHRGGELINYDLKSYGVNGIVEWMDWIARHDALPGKEQKILAQATALRRIRDQRPQEKGLTSLGGAAGAARAARARAPGVSQPQARAALKSAIDFLFSKRSSWASLAVFGVAAALWLSTVAASTGLIPGAPPAAVKDETAQFILKAATTTGSTLPPDVCAQGQNRERRLARAWAIRLSHSCPGPQNAPLVWPLVIAFGVWLGIPLTLALNGVLTGALLLALPRWLAVRRAYGKLYGSDHYTDSLADRILAVRARSQG